MGGSSAGGSRRSRRCCRCIVGTLRCCPGNKQLQPTADRTLHPLDALQEISYVSRRRMDDASFSPDAVDADGLPLVYNEVRLAGHSCMCL